MTYYFALQLSDNDLFALLEIQVRSFLEMWIIRKSMDDKYALIRHNI
jgi:hypothetical protein